MSEENWATYQIGPAVGGLVYCPLEVAIQIAKKDGEPWVKNLSDNNKVVWEREV